MFYFFRRPLWGAQVDGGGVVEPGVGAAIGNGRWGACFATRTWARSLAHISDALWEQVMELACKVIKLMVGDMSYGDYRHLANGIGHPPPARPPPLPLRPRRPASVEHALLGCPS